MEHEDALDWLRNHYEGQYDRIGRMDMRPVLDDLARVLAHIDAEFDRIHDEDEAARAVAQAEADKLPRQRWKMTAPGRDGPTGFGGFIMHRTPIDCWNADYVKHVYIDRVVHGDVIEVLAVAPDDLNSCRCIHVAVVECTDAWRETHPRYTFEAVA